MASDPSGAVSRAYGVWNPKKGLCDKGRFVIDPEEVVQALEVQAGDIGRNVERLIRQITAVQTVKENLGIAAPCHRPHGSATHMPTPPT